MLTYQLLLIIDTDFFKLHVYDTESGDTIHLFDVHPKTKKSFSRSEAEALGERICNPQFPKTKSEFFERMPSSDFQKYFEAVLDVNERFESFLSTASEQLKNFKTIIYKMDLLPEFAFSEKEMEILQEFCDVYGISVMSFFVN